MSQHPTTYVPKSAFGQWFESRLPVAGPDADGAPDVGQFRLDQQQGLATDQHLRSGDLRGGTVHDDLPDGSAEGLSQTGGIHRTGRIAHSTGGHA